MNSEQTIFATSNSTTTVLTPNRRLAATLNKRYQQYQLSQQKTCWLTPDILPFISWCERTWLQYCSQHFQQTPMLLSSIHEPFLWEKIILAAKESNQLLQVAETADICRSAWSLLQQWQIDINDPIFSATDDSMALYKWLNAFLETCKKNNWLDQASLVTSLSKLIDENKISLPQKIILVGFTEINPQMQLFIDHCESKHCSVNLVTLSKSNTLSRRVSFADSETEIIAIARWAKEKLTEQPNTNIGCVIPTLDKNRDRVAQLFNEVFATSVEKQAYNISAGKPLSEYPIIHTALQLLNLYRSYVYADYFSLILTTPFLGEAESERIARAKLDVLLRKHNVNRIALRDKLKNDAGIFYLPQYTPKLAQRIENYYCFIDALETHLLFSEWAAIFTQLLTILGWPGERSINSDEYQTVDQWLSLLKNFMSLDYISEKVTLTQAISALNKITRRHVFQPKSPDAPIQVLGLLEASGLTFDCLWIANMHDVAWPPQPKPNPLIPKRLQRELQMPHATAERELYFSKLLTEQFQQSADIIYFSHALKEDELELQASPLIQHIEEVSFSDLITDNYVTSAERIFDSKNIEYLFDHQGPSPFNKTVRGGVNVLKQQALCPFKAFAEWRLYAREIEKPLPGLRAKDRGTILHKVMEIIWNNLHDQQTLLSYSQAELDQLIQTSIEQAFLNFPLPLTNANTYLHLEKIRLHKLINEWLQIEKTRPAFTVFANEQQAQITLNQLQLTIKIDRIDQLEDGKKVIIDYKTGSSNETSSWFSERPEEPQLPLYTLLDSENIAAITFAQMVPGEHKFIGVSQYDIEIKGIKCINKIKNLDTMTWENQLLHWKNILANLSDAFYSGKAEVDPKDEQKTCLWCQLKSLCRFHEEIVV